MMEKDNDNNTTQANYISQGAASKGPIWDNHIWFVFMMMICLIMVFWSMPKGDIRRNGLALMEYETHWWWRQRKWWKTCCKAQMFQNRLVKQFFKVWDIGDISILKYHLKCYWTHLDGERYEIAFQWCVEILK